MGEPSTAVALALQIVPQGAVEVQFVRINPPAGLRVYRLTNNSFLFIFYGLHITIRDFVEPFAFPEEALLQLQLFSDTFPSLSLDLSNRESFVPESQ